MLVLTLGAAATLSACSCSDGRPLRTRPARGLERIVVSIDGRGFVRHPSQRPFIPWGFNYDHDADGRLLESYWTSEWSRVVEDLGEMAALGANVVRIHLQLGSFMRAPRDPNRSALDHLERLLEQAELSGLYLDLTGLGCYLKEDVPAWYDSLNEGERWDVQARFWEAVAVCAADSPAVFCYSLMNEPVVPDKPLAAGAWLAPPFAERYHYVQYITLDPAGRSRDAIALDWTRRLTGAIRKHDPERLITVAPLNWCLAPLGHWTGFVPSQVASELDFLSVHLYPESGRMGAAREILRGLNIGKPVVVEELFPLRCSPVELAAFMRESAGEVAGWISFYWGRTPAECASSSSLADQILATRLDEFRSGRATP